MDPVRKACLISKPGDPELYTLARCSIDYKFYFKCNVCPHIFKMAPNTISGGAWCPYCVNSKRCKDIFNCPTCLLKTFAAFDEHQKVAAWSDRNLPTRPCDISISNDGSFFFNCFNPKCMKEFKVRINNVTGKQKQWCTHCCRYNKNISAIEKKLDSLYIEYDKDTPIVINKRNLRWDVEVKNNDRIFYIESDGKQHFYLKYMMYINRNKDKSIGIKKLKDQRVRDLSKEEYIRNSGGLLFRISYRQLSEIPELVDEMIKISNLGRTGVHYMDSIYWNNIIENN